MARGAVALLVRAFTRRQWKALLVASLLLTIGGGFTLAAFAGARRTSSAATRAFDSARTADVSLDIAGIDATRLDRVRALPGVSQVSVYGYSPVRPAGSDMVPGVDVVGVMPLDRRSTRTMDTPRLISGRMPRTDRLDEVLVNPVIADRMHVGPGDTITLESYAQSEMLAVFESAEPPPPTGASSQVTVTGIGRDLAEFVDQDRAVFGVILLSPAWFEHFGYRFDNAETYDGAAGIFRIVLRSRLAGGGADVDRFLGGVFDIYGADATTVFSEARSEVFGSAETTLRVEALALLLCALAAGIATAVAVAQALTRQQFLAAVPMVEVARAVGLSRRDRVWALVLPSLAAVGVGLAAAAAGAIAASSLFPRGLGGRFEPHPGIYVDGVALLIGGLGLGLLVVFACLIGAARSSGATTAPATLVPRARIPLGRPDVGVGVRMALHTGRGATRVPARQTIIGAVAGVAGVVAAITFAGSLDRLLSTPRLFGEDYDAVVVFQGDTGEEADEAEAELLEDRRIAGLTRYGLVEVEVRGKPVRATFVDLLKGPPSLTVLSGRAPGSPNEVAVDPTQIEGAGPAIGDVISVVAGDKPVEFRVVGQRAGGGDALVMTQRGAESLGAEGGEDEPGFHVRFDDGVDGDAVRRDLGKRFAEVYPVTPAAAVTNLDHVRGFPYALAVLLAVLAAAAVGHLLASGVRRRGRDLAVLKALGFSRRRTRATVHWQAVTVMVIAVIVGSVLGVALGRGAWGLVASSIRVAFAPAVPPLGMLSVALLALVVGLAVAAVPAGVAARTRPAVVLRAE
ncbi:MAG TPA: ABC transporter permease [Acidimicrobiales bacterium]|nr:ABC transporter permease [Acidimicrobiales bacterium]